MSRVRFPPVTRPQTLMSFPQIQDTGLTLAGVVGFASHAQKWTKFEDAEPLSFMPSFWGEAWPMRRRNGSRCVSRILKDLRRRSVTDYVTDGDDAGMKNSADVNLNNINNADVDKCDHEFMSGCFELDTSDNPLLPVPRIWIRVDYMRVYKYIESRHDHCYSSPRAQSVVVTGPPGTGKCGCLCLYYVYH
jgi:hypothetical protein